MVYFDFGATWRKYVRDERAEHRNAAWGGMMMYPGTAIEYGAGTVAAITPVLGVDTLVEEIKERRRLAAEWALD